MIKVQDWIASIPDEEKHVAYVGEGKSVEKEFLLCGDGWEHYTEWTFYLDMAFDLESITKRDTREVVATTVDSWEMTEEGAVTTQETVTKESYTVHNEDRPDYYREDIAPLIKRVDKDGIHLIWTVLRQHTVLPGKLWATLRAVSGEIDEVKKSAIMVFEVDNAICALPAATPPISEMEQIRQQAAAAKDAATAASDGANAAANRAYQAAADALNCRFECENRAELMTQKWEETAAYAQTAQQAQAEAADYAQEAQQAQEQATQYSDAAHEQAVKAQQAANAALDAADISIDAAAQAADAAAAAEEAAERNKTLIVTTEWVQNDMVSVMKSTHSALQIYEHVQNGGTAVFAFGGEYVDLSGCTAETAVFSVVRMEDEKGEVAKIITVDNDKSFRLVDGVLGDRELEGRVTTVENALFGAPAPETDPVETVTVTNVISNPQFADGTTGWTMVNGDGVDMTVTDGVLCLTETAPTNKLQQLRSNNIKSSLSSAIGHRIYMCAKVKYEGKLPPTVGTKFSTTENVHWTAVASTNPTLGDWCYMSSICDYILSPNSGLYVVVSNNYGTTDIVGAKCYVDNVVCIDLTAAFGEGNEPDIATMDRWVAEQYADGFTGTATLALTAEDDGEGDEENGGEKTPGLVDKVAALENDVANLNTEVADLAEAMENLPCVEVQQTGTVYPTLHEHYISNIEAAKPDYYGKQDANTLTFAMMADMHLLANSKTILPNVEASSAWAKLVGHDFVMMGGDFIIGDESKTVSLGYIDTLMEMAEKHANCPVYAVKGNHDTCEETSDKADRITEKEFYLHANARGEKYGMVTDPEHPYAGYYYVDFPRQKIRMVCLNTTEIKESEDILTASNSAFRWSGVKSTNQVNWVRDVALRVPEGWAVMMVSHIPPITGADLGVTDTGDAADTGAPFHNRGISSPAVVALCKAFADGTAGTANVTASGSVKISYDFTEQGAREFIGHFCGHVHEDSLSVYNGLNYVVVNSTTPTKRWATSLDRTADTDKLSLNSFIINRATRTVECIKIGAAPGEDNAWWADSFTW